eukprot:TRINITY_DN2253_c0_g3_i3.p1 TRINITY_DN2253_c0_g3~~TRINITY_DN2253_c0_g3_i3.p1  ORF type:complete len:297 (-),score=69.39 TRINITY_DN2253_c0_g3_i3:16-906(-)
MHLGHLLPFLFTAYLQKILHVPVVIQITDDEKYLFRDLPEDVIKQNLLNNVADIIACGYDLENTFIFSNLKYMGDLYPFVVRVQAHATNSKIKAIFGIKDSDNIGKTGFPVVQAAPSFQSSFKKVLGKDTERRCLIPCGIDQDPYFRMTRDVTSKLRYLKPALIHSKFLPPLYDFEHKMSASDPNSAIFLTDDKNTIKKKIFRYAASGGKDSVELHRKFGGDVNVDVSFQYLKFFLEDDAQLKQIEEKYTSGQMLTGELKKIAVDVISGVVERHKKMRETVDVAIVKKFMRVRKLG